MIDDQIKTIIAASIRAPSGENCQPWRFEVKENKIILYNLPERDKSLYNWGQRASYIAHGALIENITIVAGAEGFHCEVSLFPESNNPNHVASITLAPSNNGTSGDLHTFISLRSTNRKPYKNLRLTENQRQKLLDTNSNYSQKNPKLLLVEDNEKKNILAVAAGMNEKILLENRLLHSFFFSHINWTKEEEEKNRTGFFIKSLELPPPALIGFKLFKYWAVLNILNKIGASNFVAKDNSKVYAKSSAFGAISIKSTSPEDFVNAGRLMERAWLESTKLGLSIQPLTGVLFFMLRINAGDITHFSTEHVELIKKTYNNIKNIFELGEETLAMMFRIGQGDAPSALSLRLKPDIS